jgi:hypothetical protein
MASLVGKRLAMFAVVLTAAISSCSAGIDQGRDDGRVWAIGLDHPIGPWDQCVDREAAQHIIIAPSVPEAYVLIILKDNQTRSASDRVASCIEAKLESGTVIVEYDYPPGTTETSASGP